VTVRQEEKEEEASSSNPDRQCVLAISNLKSESELVNDDDDEIQFSSPRSESTHTLRLVSSLFLCTAIL
jgi:hypothetical protein